MAEARPILSGLRVLDLTRMLSGPYCTMLMADLGAEVVKIESGAGDTSRSTGPWRDDDPARDWAGYFVSLNRSKRSVTLDLKSGEGKAAFLGLAATADVVVENFRPGVMDRLGLGYETLAARNPRLVYGAIRGFGDPRTGASPYVGWPAYDVVAQAMGGLIALTGPDAETPTKVGPGVGDIFTGTLAAFGILAALREAEATGRGQFVDVGMVDAILSLCERSVYQYDFDGRIPGPEGNSHPFLAPFGLFPATDGMVALGIVDDSFWAAFTEAMGAPELAADPRFATTSARGANRVEVCRIAAAWTGGLTKAELAERLGGRVPFGPVNTVADIMADPHVAARGMIAEVPHPDGRRPWRVAASPVRFSRSAIPAPATPPRLGADTERLMAEADAARVPAIDTRALRDAFGTFATGITVVTCREADGTPRGFTANSFTSVSLDPPLLLVCIAKGAASFEAFAAASHFGVSVLGEEQKEVSGLFATRRADKFEAAPWHAGHAGVPLVDAALGWFACARHRLVDAGDHVILIGRVEAFGERDGAPLGYFRGSYFTPGLERPLVQAATEGGATVVGVLIEREGAVFLAEGPEGLVLPTTAPGDDGLEGLLARLESEGLPVALDFLYAVYRERGTGTHRIYYHGRSHGRTAPAAGAFHGLGAIPWDRIARGPERMMLKRYAEEHTHGVFGVYEGDEVSGRVRRLWA